MKLSFFQAALIAIVTNATEVEEPSYEDMYFPDLLVQTDRLVQYFFPQVESDELEESEDIQFAQIDSESHGHSHLLSNLDLEAQLKARTQADIEAESELESEINADSNLDTESFAEGKTESISDALIDTDALNQLQINCQGNVECLKSELASMTRVHVKDKLENDITIEMPALEKKKITFESPTLTVTDAGFDSAVAKKIAPPKAIPEADDGCAAEAPAKKAAKKPALGKGASKQIAAEHKPTETPEEADLAQIEGEIDDDEFDY